MGKSDLVAHFFQATAFTFKEKVARLGLIATNTIAQGRYPQQWPAMDLPKRRHDLLSHASDTNGLGTADVVVSVVHLLKGDYAGFQARLEQRPVEQKINAFLLQMAVMKTQRSSGQRRQELSGLDRIWNGISLSMIWIGDDDKAGKSSKHDERLNR